MGYLGHYDAHAFLFTKRFVINECQWSYCNTMVTLPGDLNRTLAMIVLNILHELREE